MMDSFLRIWLLLAQLACSLFLPELARADIRLEHSYPEPGNYNLVHLTCRENSIFSESYEDAEFFLRSARDSSGVATRLSGQAVDSGLTVTISPSTEGALTCEHDGDTSSPVYLAAQPQRDDYFDCTTNEDNPIQYQLLPYSEQDRYSIPCTVRPGALRMRYAIEWLSHAANNGFKQHTNINMTTFDLYLNSSQLEPLYSERKWLRCRVAIDHDQDTEERYCGTRIRAAVKAEITTPLPPQSSLTIGSSLNLTCLATGTQLDISWTYRGEAISLSDGCRNGVCVYSDLSPSPPSSSSSSPSSSSSSSSSRLSVTGMETAVGSSPVACIVRQNLPTSFGAEVVRSDGMITVGIASNPPITPITTVTPITPVAPTSNVSSSLTPDTPTSPPSQGTPSPDSLFRPVHVTIVLIVVPIGVVIVIVCYIRYRFKSCKERGFTPGRILEDGAADSSMRYDRLARYDHLPSAEPVYETISPASTISPHPPLTTANPLLSLTAGSEETDCPSLPPYIISPPPPVCTFTLPRGLCVSINSADPLHKNGFPQYLTITSPTPLQANTQGYDMNGPWENFTANDPPHMTTNGFKSHFSPHSARQVVVSSRCCSSSPPAAFTVNEVVLRLGNGGSKVKICSVDSMNQSRMVSAQLESVSMTTTHSEDTPISPCETTSFTDSDPLIYEVLNPDQSRPRETTAGTNQPQLQDCDKEDHTGPQETTAALYGPPQ